MRIQELERKTGLERPSIRFYEKEGLVQQGLYILRYCQLTGRSWRRFARYDEVEGPHDMPWDETTEIVYENRDVKRGVAIGVILAMSVLLITGTVLDAFRPRHRSSELTVSQIAENYNATLGILNNGAVYYDHFRRTGARSR